MTPAQFIAKLIALVPERALAPDRVRGLRLGIPRRSRSVTMTPEQFIAKLIALVPAPGVPMIRSVR